MFLEKIHLNQVWNENALNIILLTTASAKDCQSNLVSKRVELTKLKMAYMV